MTLKSAVLSLVLVLPSPGLAEDHSGPNVNPSVLAAKGAVATYMLAQDLYVLGQANNDPLTVLTAARLAASVRLDEGEVKPEPVAAAKTKGEMAAGPAGGVQMMAVAKAMAAPDERLDPLILDADSLTAIGAVQPVKVMTSQLGAGQSERWKLAFFADAHAEVAVLGGGASNLDVLITDEAGNTICYEAGPVDHAYCGFVPAWNGYYTVTVQNSGEAGEGYLLLNN